MSVEVTVLISIVSVAAAIYFGLKSAKRDDTKDIKERATADAIVNVKLDNISSAVNDIKYDISDTKKQVAEIDKKLVAVDASVRSAHHRIDNMEKGEDSHAER
jgi:septal ring factor EnvC (AmiA/AmiB activator)